jgi:large subunit ribosomal protein L6e
MVGEKAPDTKKKKPAAKKAGSDAAASRPRGCQRSQKGSP